MAGIHRESVARCRIQLRKIYVINKNGLPNIFHRIYKLTKWPNRSLLAHDEEGKPLNHLYLEHVRLVNVNVYKKPWVSLKWLQRVGSVSSSPRLNHKEALFYTAQNISLRLSFPLSSLFVLLAYLVLHGSLKLFWWAGLWLFQWPGAEWNHCICTESESQSMTWIIDNWELKVVALELTGCNLGTGQTGALLCLG